jgi:subtilisin family serine protease
MATRKKPAAKTASAAATSTPGEIPKRIFAQVSPKSIGGTSLFESDAYLRSETIGYFTSEPELIRRTVSRLEDAGFEILQVNSLTINIAGPQKTFEKAFGASIYAEERDCLKEVGGSDNSATFLEAKDASRSGMIETRGGSMGDLVEGVALEVPRYFFAPSMYPPLKSYWHLEVPAGVSLGCNADKAHRGGITGKDIKIAMVDSGHFAHPFFAGRGYRVSPVLLGPAAANPLKDESGHGTGESANIFAVAPDIQLMPVKINFVNSTGAFNAAVGLAPHIITCSWGSSIQFGPLSAGDMALAAAVAAAVASGIIVVFSAGNGHFGFPGQHPDVISAGGVYMDKDESLRASDYASGFMSNVYPGRRVPDLSGLVGMKPGANYIMLPLEPGDDIDVSKSGNPFPTKDETANNDGWAAFSGTSAAAPQLAGAAALIKQACPKLKPAEVREILMKTAKDVTVGNCNTSSGGAAAGPGPDVATGNGLVDAHKAVLTAKLKCIPIIPIGNPIGNPIVPIGNPITPIGNPITPIGGPITPITIQPGPIAPIVAGPVPPQPITAPIVNPPPIAVGPQPGGGGQSSGSSSLSAEDVAALEELIIKSDFNF